MNDSPMTADGRQLVNRPLVQAHLLASFGWFVLSILAGLLFSTQFVRNYVFPDVELLSPGRIRMVHTHLVAFGWIFNALLAGMIWSIPRLTGQRILSDGLGWLIFVVWQSIMAAAVVGILMGQAQGLEWGENPVWIDPLVVVGWVLVVTNLITPILRSKERNLYVSLWYFLAAFIWTGLTYVMGNFFPQYWVPGVAGAAVTGLYIHDLVGLFVTPIGWGLMYYFVPIILKRPIWSHAMSLIGFWGLAFFYPLNGVHHYLYSPIPMYVQYGAVVSTVAVEFVVTTVVINFFMSIRYDFDKLRTSLPMRWFYTGMILYFITCLQCAFQVTLSFQKIIHFTDWVVAHAHLVMFGVFSFWIFGIIIHLWPKLTDREWAIPKLNEWHYWLTTIGLVVMFLDLTIAGLIQGFSWRSLAPWEESLMASIPFWWVRVFSGYMITAGTLCLLVNIVATWRNPTRETAPELKPATA
jgi:cytochrome c oxidase cbb3-type subunit 1